jgi:hypothetical protein
MISITNLTCENSFYVGTANISINTSCINLKKLYDKAKNDFYNELNYLSQKKVLSNSNNTVLADKYMLDYILSFVQKTRKFKFSNIQQIGEAYTLVPYLNNFGVRSAEKYYIEDENIFLGKKYNKLEKDIEAKGFLMFDKQCDVNIRFDLFCIKKDSTTPFLKIRNNIINILNPMSGIYHSHNFKNYAVIGVSNFEKNVETSFMKLALMLYSFGINKGNMSLCMLDAIDWLRQYINNIGEGKICEYNKQTLFEELNKIEKLPCSIFTEDTVSNFKNFAISFN